jgi:hypothetical protein
MAEGKKPFSIIPLQAVERGNPQISPLILLHLRYFIRYEAVARAQVQEKIFMGVLRPGKDGQE